MTEPFGSESMEEQPAVGNTLIIRNKVCLHVMDFTTAIYPAIFYLLNHTLILQSDPVVTIPSGVIIDLWFTLKNTMMEKN